MLCNVVVAFVEYLFVGSSSDGTALHIISLVFNALHETNVELLGMKGEEELLERASPTLNAKLGLLEWILDNFQLGVCQMVDI